MGQALDPSGELLQSLVVRFSSRLRHLHLSVLAAGCSHWPSQPQDLSWMLPQLASLAHLPFIWEELPLFTSPEVMFDPEWD